MIRFRLQGLTNPLRRLIRESPMLAKLPEKLPALCGKRKPLHGGFTAGAVAKADFDMLELFAQAFLKDTRRKFDLVIDDVFVGNARTLRKPDWLPLPGLDRALRCLRPGGVLVSNTLDERRAVARALGERLPRFRALLARVDPLGRGSCEVENR